MTTGHVTSRDGTRIAFDQLGAGPPLLLIAGLLCDRQTLRPLADALADRFMVVTYDRRGRGGSGDTAPYTVEREIDDCAALIAELGGSAAVYGHSSGAGVAAHAAAAGLPITRLVLHEPPYGPDDEQSVRSTRALSDAVHAAVADARPADAIALFLADSGLPSEVIEQMSADPRSQALAATMPYDFAVMGDDTRGGTIPEEMFARIAVPTLVLAGGASDAFFRDTAARLVQILPNATHAVLDGQDHAAPATAVAPVIAAFLAPAASSGRSGSR